MRNLRYGLFAAAIVAAGLADKCEVQVAYAIGVAEPVSIMVNTFGTGKIPANEIARIVREEFDLRPSAIIRTLDLLRPIYRKTAAYGHFGRASETREVHGKRVQLFTWEQAAKVAELKDAIRRVA